MLWETFFTHHLFGKSKYLSPIVGTLSMILFKKYGLGLLNPVTSENKEYLSLQCASTDMIRSMTGEGKFSNANHLLVLR